MSDPGFEILNPNRQLTDKEVLLALSNKGGSVVDAAQVLNVTPQRLSRYCATRPEIQEALAEYRKSMVDIAEHHLANAVAEGEKWAIHLVLTTLGKNRGYTQRDVKEEEKNKKAPGAMSDTELMEEVKKRVRAKQVEVLHHSLVDKTQQD